MSDERALEAEILREELWSTLTEPAWRIALRIFDVVELAGPFRSPKNPRAALAVKFDKLTGDREIAEVEDEGRREGVSSRAMRTCAARHNALFFRKLAKLFSAEELSLCRIRPDGSLAPLDGGEDAL